VTLGLLNDIKTYWEGRRSMVRKIYAYSNHPHRNSCQPEVTAPPSLVEADVCSPEEIHQGKNGEDW
jgi:hypothetical protein